MSDQEISRNFKGIWIPRHIWLNQELNLLEKVLWAEIDSLDHEERGCTASNEYFQKFFGTCERTVQNALAKLKSLKLIRVESFNGRKRSLRSVGEMQRKSFEQRCTSEVKDYAPLRCNILHPYNKGDNKDLSVCKPDPHVCGSPGNKILDFVVKRDFEGKEFEVSLEKVFQEAVLKNKNWNAQEIREAWKILRDCQSPIRDPIAYIEGTIDKFRNIKKSELLKRKEKCQISKQMSQNGSSKPEEICSMNKSETPMDRDIWEQQLKEYALEMKNRKKS